jgi:two-component system, LytTR family, sensor kinase
VNALGHMAGAVVFGIFLFLLLTDSAGARDSRLSIAAAALSFVWNLGSLIGLTLSEGTALASAITAASFAALSLLPAVLLHIALDRTNPLVYWSGYLLSGLAVALHVAEPVVGNPEYHRRAITLIEFGFIVLTAIAAIAIAREGHRRSLPRVLGTMGLALFALSFVHFGSGHQHTIWSSELFIHHAGLPLALFVLLQDHRFVLLDAFVRFLANGLLSALMTLAAYRAFEWLYANSALRDSKASAGFVFEAVILAGVAVLLILFAVFRGALQRWLTRVVFRHPDWDQAIEEIRTGSPGQGLGATRGQSPVDGFLDWATKTTAGFVNAEQFGLLTATDRKPAWAEVSLPVRGGMSICLGRRRGGRRYLSEDRNFLDRVTAAISQRVEEFHAQQLQSLVSQAELRALQSQINPHFLFNALNTLYGVIPRQSPEARRMVRNLADMFRYSLQSAEGALVPLERELQIVDAYLEIEQLRMGDRLKIDRQVDPAAMRVTIPVFSIQPLVENAIKHGVSRNPQGGILRLKIEIRGEQLAVSIEDSGCGTGSIPPADPGVGMTNVRKRLALCYGAAARLEAAFEASGSHVEMVVPAAQELARA